MKAAVIDHDAPAHVSIREVDPPMPAPDEALVRVAAVSLNRGELRYAQSRDPDGPIGWDFAGTVEQSAADGSGPSEGARVVGFLMSGAWAELAAVPANSLAELPDNVSFADAATLPVAGLTALYATEKAHALLGRNALVTGASGGVGLFACQIARLYGARAVGLVRRHEHVHLVESAGADEVTVSEDGSAAADFGPYRLVVDSVGGSVLGNAMRMLTSDGVCVTLGISAGPDCTFSIGPFMRTGRAILYGFLLFNELDREPASEGLARLVSLVAQDRLKTFITVEEDWGRLSDIARDYWDRRYTGKVVLHVGA